MPSQDSFPLYGGRGIKVSEAWRSFEQFLSDVGEQPAGCSIDRIDPDGNYEPGNCRWASGLEQLRNKRNNNRLTFNGRTMCISAWADEVGLKARTLRARIYDHGMSVEEALTAPLRYNARKQGKSDTL